MRILYWHDPMVPAQKFNRRKVRPVHDMHSCPVRRVGPQACAVRPSLRVRAELGSARFRSYRGPNRARVISGTGNRRLQRARRGTGLQAPARPLASGFVSCARALHALTAVLQGTPADLYLPDWVSPRKVFGQSNICHSPMLPISLRGRASACALRA